MCWLLVQQFPFLPTRTPKREKKSCRNIGMPSKCKWPLPQKKEKEGEGGGLDTDRFFYFFWAQESRQHNSIIFFENPCKHKLVTYNMAHNIADQKNFSFFNLRESPDWFFRPFSDLVLFFLFLPKTFFRSRKARGGRGGGRWWHISPHPSSLVQ